MLEIYATGLGALEPAPADGEAGGGAPSLVGVNVVLARVPAGIAPNDALEVQLEVGGARSQPGVTIAVE